MTKVNKELISSFEAAKILKLSRTGLFKKIKSGELRAEKIGRNYVIRMDDLESLENPKTQRARDSKGIQRAVNRTVSEYKETLELLGKEDARK